MCVCDLGQYLRRVLGRGQLCVFSARNRTGPAFLLQNEPFPDFFLLVPLLKKTKRRERYRITVAVRLLFEGFSVDAPRRALRRGQLYF